MELVTDILKVRNTRHINSAFAALDAYRLSLNFGTEYGYRERYLFFHLFSFSLLGRDLGRNNVIIVNY